jgi:hypothetical protein
MLIDDPVKEFFPVLVRTKRKWGPPVVSPHSILGNGCYLGMLPAILST